MELAEGFIIHKSVPIPLFVLLFGVEINKSNLLENKSSKIELNISLPGPPESVAYSPIKSTWNKLLFEFFIKLFLKLSFLSLNWLKTWEKIVLLNSASIIFNLAKFNAIILSTKILNVCVVYLSLKFFSIYFFFVILSIHSL